MAQHGTAPNTTQLTMANCYNISISFQSLDGRTIRVDDAGNGRSGGGGGGSRGGYGGGGRGRVFFFSHNSLIWLSHLWHINLFLINGMLNVSSLWYLCRWWRIQK